MTLLPPPTVLISKQDLLDLLDRLLPEHYIEPLKTGSGYEILQAFAEIYTAISQGVVDTGTDSQIATADDGAYATGQVELYRREIPVQGEPLPGQIGHVASIVTGALAGHARITGLSGMTVASIGHFLHLSNTASPQNTGAFYIDGYNSPSSVDIVSAYAVIPDANNGTITWIEETHEVIVNGGTIVTTSIGGRDFQTMQDITFGPFELGPKTVLIQAISKGYEWNVRGQRIAADSSVLPGSIDTVKTLIETPVLLDTTILVRQIADTSGGEDSTLGALGADRGIGRLPGEPTEAYRTRIRALPDTISPNAIYRTILNILRPANMGFTFLETWSSVYQTCWDAPNTQITGSSFNPDLLAYDHPDNVPFRGRWLDENDYRGGIIVVVDPTQPLTDYGPVFDDLGTEPHDFVGTVSLGQRAYSAWDIPTGFTFGLIGAYDGLDYRKASIFRGLYDTLQAIKPAGVSAAVELKGE